MRKLLLLLLLPTLMFGQLYTQNIPWSNFLNNPSGGGNDCVLTINPVTGILSLSFNCNFSPTSISYHHVVDILYSGTLQDMTLGNIPNNSNITPYVITIVNKKLYISSGTSLVTGFIGTINTSYVSSGTSFITSSSSSQNFVKTTDYFTDYNDGGYKSINYTYYDGLGRPSQKVAVGQSGTGKNLVTPIEYDAFGRQDKEYLPYATPNSSEEYNPTASTAILNYESYLGQNPFSKKQFETSPLNRILKQAAPGLDWSLDSGHEIKLDYNTNSANEVKFFKASTTAAYDINLVNSTGSDFYGANQLFKTITYDENTAANPSETSGSTIEFKNKEGQIILKRTYSNYVSQNAYYVPHDTYYVYDQYGNLTYVIPPKADGAITTQVLNDLCYQYKYDARNRLVEKKLPGKQWEFIVYDKLDRAVMTGPAFSPFKEDPNIGWNITKYDAFNRPVYTGWYSGLQPNSNNRVSLQNMQNLPATVVSEKRTSPTTIGYIAVAYTNLTEPKTGFYLLSVSYYDDYNFPNAALIPTKALSQDVRTNVKTALTGAWVRVLTNSGEFYGQATTIFYDLKGRPIRNSKSNYLGGFTQIDSELSFAGKTLNTVTTHKLSSSSSDILKLTNTYSYTPQMRLKTHSNQINTLPIQLISKNEYDELGQLIVKRVGGTDTTGLTSLQKVDYSYNIRGWLTGINNDITNKLVLNNSENDLFGFKINYNTSEDEINYTGTPLYNGNISETYWRTKSDNSLKKYGYQYDNLNRLTNAIYQKPGSGTVVTNAYNERLGYDKNGNIIGLQRNGKRDEAFVGIDNLGYAYQGNQLKGVRDFSQHPEGFIDDNNNSMDDYRYDANGNLILDANKKISSIVYNHLNLPVRITFSSIVTTYQGSTTPYANIDYIYTANGEKLEKTVTINGVSTNTKYIDGFNYLNNVLQFFPTTEGYVSYKGGAYNYVFNYTDHLGNVRLSYQDKNKNGNISSVDEILEENNYYPFGLKQEGENAINGQPNYKYKYNGKELQDELGLNFYDYGARNYDPALGRWMNVDPLAEKFPGYSPYNYCFNNPVRLVDPDGRSPQDIIVTTKDGKALFTLDDGKKAITKMTVAQLYKTGTQWFEPLADNYMPLKSQTKELSTTDKVKHFTSSEISEFSNEDRWMMSYRQGGSGDWKASEKGADGFLLSTVDEIPYWSDAIGQIPFAVDYATDMKDKGKTGYQAIRETVQKGKEYGEGKLIGGTTDNSNTYDNYFILRGAANGANGRNITKPVTKEEAKAYGL